MKKNLCLALGLVGVIGDAAAAHSGVPMRLPSRPAPAIPVPSRPAPTRPAFEYGSGSGVTREHVDALNKLYEANAELVAIREQREAREAAELALIKDPADDAGEHASTARNDGEDTPASRATEPSDQPTSPGPEVAEVSFRYQPPTSPSVLAKDASARSLVRRQREPSQLEKLTDELEQLAVPAPAAIPVPAGSFRGLGPVPTTPPPPVPAKQSRLLHQSDASSDAQAGTAKAATEVAPTAPREKLRRSNIADLAGQLEKIAAAAPPPLSGQ